MKALADFLQYTRSSTVHERPARNPIHGGVFIPEEHAQNAIQRNLSTRSDEDLETLRCQAQQFIEEIEGTLAGRTDEAFDHDRERDADDGQQYADPRDEMNERRDR